MNKGMNALLGAFTIALLIAGCGGGGNTESGPVSKPEFIKQGDAVCKKGNKLSEDEVEAFAKEKGFQLEKANKSQGEEVVTEVLVPNLERQIEEFKELTPPVGDEKKIEKIISSLEEATKEFNEHPERFFEEDALKKPSKLELAYGFKVCG